MNMDEMEEFLSNSNFIEDQEYQYHSIKYVAQINMLNDDCLIYIFQFLSAEERIKLERVCKYWQRISRESWYDIKSFNTYNQKWIQFDDCRKLKSEAVYNILKRCGRFIKKLEFFGYIEELEVIGANLGLLCPNIQSIKLSGIWNTTIKNLANNCTDIRDLYLRDTIYKCNEEFSYEETLSLLFSRNKKLRTLVLLSEYAMNGGKCLQDLPAESMNRIIILDSNISSNYFNQAIQKLKNLSALTFDLCPDLDNESLEAISKVKSLEEIQTGYLLGSINYLGPLIKLSNLKIVEFSLCNSVDDAFLIKLSKHCRELSDVDISGCCRVTDAGVAHITTLPKLEQLFVNNLEITNKAFNPMPNLKKIECYSCNFLCDLCFIKIVETSESLDLLNTCFCNITNLTIKAAIKATKKRTNNRMLRLFVYGTRVKIRKIKDKSPLLQIITARRKHQAKCYAL